MKGNTDIALLLIRIGLGAVFIAHGYAKIVDMDGTLAFFSTLGLPAFVAYAIAWIELVGGALVLLGIATGLAGVLLAATMAGAIVLVKLSKGFLGGYEFDLMLFLASIAVALAGSGAYTVKRFLRGEEL